MANDRLASKTRIFDLEPLDPILSEQYGPGQFIGFIGDGLECQISIFRSLADESEERLRYMFAFLNNLEGDAYQKALADVRTRKVQSNPIVFTSTISIPE